MTRTALVTGSHGFIGSHLVPRLRQEGYQVTAVDLRAPEPGAVERLAEEQARRFDVIYHLAAHIPDVAARLNGDILQYQDLALDYAMAAYVARSPPNGAFVWPTSCAVDYADDPYAFCKRTSERLFGSLSKSGVSVRILRPYSGHGPDQALTYPFPAILRRALKRENPLAVWGSGEQIRDFINISDLVDAFLLAKTDMWPVGVPVDIGTGIGVSMQELARMIADEVGYKPEIRLEKDKPDASRVRIADTRMADSLGFRARIGLRESIRLAVAYHTERGIAD